VSLRHGLEALGTFTLMKWRCREYSGIDPDEGLAWRSMGEWVGEYKSGPNPEDDTVRGLVFNPLALKCVNKYSKVVGCTLHQPAG